MQNILLMMPYLEGEVAVFRHAGEARGGRHECVVSERREQEHVLIAVRCRLERNEGSKHFRAFISVPENKYRTGASSKQIGNMLGL